MATADRFIRTLARWLALTGGLVLVALIVITTASIVGRLLNSIGYSQWISDWLPILIAPLQWFRPITGDFELVEAGIAFAIMAFIPWCQISRGHAKVEVLTGLLPSSSNRWLAFLWEAVFCATYILIAWRLVVGTGDKMRYNETSFMLQFPVWWGYAAVTGAALLACWVALWSLFLHGREALGYEPLSKTVSRTA
ncbi:TRAP transporter small permease [Ahrensia sp. R2A130]|uniref:TRAP transporter small permease n=1 Tax=Ahrensia sp. R2A130 TaxID=744979 RepID=UPI0001E0C9F6|nr:TRAP transporter small permease [Ahrensia sp. R2A130]EFL88802.1 putative trap-type c4-dicarboxylate transport system, small permease component [Ahrensia sp. R2A130]